MKLNSINRQILALTIPSIVANITTPLLGLIDTAIVGHMGSAVYIAAIAVAGSVFNLLYWCFGFLRAGTSGMTAQAFGAGDTRLQAITLTRGLLISAVVGVLMILSVNVVADAMLAFMDTRQPVADIARGYVNIVIWGAPAVLAGYCFAGWFIGRQDTRSPMWVAIAINIVNIALSLYLTYALHWGVTGLAVGTLSAQWFGTLLSVILARKHSAALNWHGWRQIINWTGIRRFFAVNISIFLRTLCLIAVTLWFTRAGSIQGPVILAVNALIMQFFLLMSYFMDGFAYAGEALVGKFVGARDYTQLIATIKHLLLWGLAVAIIFTAIYGFAGQWMLSILSDEPSVIEASKEYYIWAVAVPLAGFTAFVFDGVFIGATLTRHMLWSMLVAMAVFFALYYILTPSLANHGLWLAFTAYLILRGLILAVIAYSRLNVRPRR